MHCLMCVVFGNQNWEEEEKLRRRLFGDISDTSWKAILPFVRRVRAGIALCVSEPLPISEVAPDRGKFCKAPCSFVKGASHPITLSRAQLSHHRLQSSLMFYRSDNRAVDQMRPV